jgi:hypothetical protein
MKEIQIIPIAQRKAEKRRIRKEWIEEAVLNPSQVVTGYGGRKVAQKKLSMGDREYLLRVVYEESREVCTVVTAYVTSQVTRYWKEET